MIPRVGAVLLAVLGIAVLSCQLTDASAPVSDVTAPEVVPVAADPVVEYIEARAASLTREEVVRVAAAIRGEALRFGLTLELVLAVIEVESRFDAFAVSSVGALGLMQILPSTGEALAARLDIPWQGPRTLLDPVTNVTLGIAYLAELQARFGHWPTALAAYNRGPSAIGRRLSAGVPIPDGYAQRVRAAQRRGAASGASTS
ncbi:MAG: lytic transglycosylase domain-containing protein [Myxococcota bacterium]|jgi:soluble lytic murein transglycosylase-like protein|nr:hypothetical protein [Deltaproteobacteria bacterium]MCP4240049.1 lytic transglycosylase domain-containing protein [bacterium]MDP6076069.1 lytic transglycosylase domain-containing protein [Myxococcota bacterium]MDP6244509.1 lytic transglycosylase domain-containing protein [Myxococcota bacterium]MDP7073583.1 lytic transglycosylase domain-containing protein [Myxococcota bacterium]